MWSKFKGTFLKSLEFLNITLHFEGYGHGDINLFLSTSCHRESTRTLVQTSFIETTNSKGPRTDPYGTPDVVYTGCSVKEMAHTLRKLEK